MENLIERSNLVMPQNCIELDREEMSYVEGGGSVSLYVQFSLGAAIASFGTGFVSSFIVSYLTVKIGKSIPTWVGKIIGAAVGATLGTVVASAINRGASIIKVPIFYCWIPFVSYSHTFDLGDTVYDIISSIGGGMGGGLSGAALGATAGLIY